jgi:hypothetical protein
MYKAIEGHEHGHLMVLRRCDSVNHHPIAIADARDQPLRGRNKRSTHPVSQNAKIKSTPKLFIINTLMHSLRRAHSQMAVYYVLIIRNITVFRALYLIFIF